MTFSELIEKVLNENSEPMTASEIWKYAEQKGYSKQLNGSGKNPKNTLASILYTDQKKSNKKYIVCSTSPKGFKLNKSL